jgi:hypothetical protein
LIAVNDELVQRLKRVERRYAILVSAFLVALLVSVVSFCLSLSKVERVSRPAAVPPEVIKLKTVIAQSVQVLGPTGKNSVSLTATEDGWAIISFRDVKGSQKAALLLTPSGKPSLNFFDDKVARLTLGVVDVPNGRGEEFSLQLKDTNSAVIWHPEVLNTY